MTTFVQIERVGGAANDEQAVKPGKHLRVRVFLRDGSGARDLGVLLRGSEAFCGLAARLVLLRELDLCAAFDLLAETLGELPPPKLRLEESRALVLVQSETA